jgi:hypothetical protein
MPTSSWQAAQLQLDEFTHCPVMLYRSISGPPTHVAVRFEKRNVKMRGSSE